MRSINKLGNVVKEFMNRVNLETTYEKNPVAEGKVKI